MRSIAGAARAAAVGPAGRKGRARPHTADRAGAAPFLNCRLRLEPGCRPLRHRPSPVAGRPVVVCGRPGRGKRGSSRAIARSPRGRRRAGSVGPTPKGEGELDHPGASRSRPAGPTSGPESALRGSHAGSAGWLPVGALARSSVRWRARDGARWRATRARDMTGAGRGSGPAFRGTRFGVPVSAALRRRRSGPCVAARAGRRAEGSPTAGADGGA